MLQNQLLNLKRKSNPYICYVKFLIGLFSIYFLLLCGVPCSVKSYFDSPDKCCQLDFNHTTQKSSQEEHSDNDCDSCNPLSSCHCTGSFISFFHNFSFSDTVVPKAVQISDVAVFVVSVPAAIWQPPKI